jgi:hypothetical protein
VLGACRASLSEKTLVTLYGPQVPKACECFMQLRRAVCSMTPKGQEICDHYTVRHWNHLKCYHRGNLPADQQYSDWPDPDEQNGGCMCIIRLPCPASCISQCDSPYRYLFPTVKGRWTL